MESPAQASPGCFATIIQHQSLISCGGKVRGGGDTLTPAVLGEGGSHSSPPFMIIILGVARYHPQLLTDEGAEGTPESLPDPQLKTLIVCFILRGFFLFSEGDTYTWRQNEWDPGDMAARCSIHNPTRASHSSAPTVSCFFP